MGPPENAPWGGFMFDAVQYAVSYPLWILYIPTTLRWRFVALIFLCCFFPGAGNQSPPDIHSKSELSFPWSFLFLATLFVLTKGYITACFFPLPY